MTTDPFTALGVDENAGDEAIKQRYLALVRAHPPDREPERFQEYRRAYEAVRGERERLEVQLLQTSSGALTRLKLHCLRTAGTERRRPSEATMAALFLDGLYQADR
jgi:curved DNA-binding protein CbpA